MEAAIGRFRWALALGTAMWVAAPAAAGPEVPQYPMMMPAPGVPPAPGSLWNEANARVMIGMARFSRPRRHAVAARSWT